MGVAAAGHAETVETLLSTNKVEVNEKTLCGRSALSYAIGNGHIEVSGLLLKPPNIGVNSINIERSTPLLNTLRDGNEAVLRLLHEDGRANLVHADRRDRSVLSCAAKYGYVEIAKLLTRPPVLYAAGEGHLQIVRLLWGAGKINFGVSDSEGFDTVMLAPKSHHVNVLEYLFKKDPEGIMAVDIDGPPLLRFAFMGNSSRPLETIDFLLNSNLVDLEQQENTGRAKLEQQRKKAQKSRAAFHTM